MLKNDVSNALLHKINTDIPFPDSLSGFLVIARAWKDPSARMAFTIPPPVLPVAPNTTITGLVILRVIWFVFETVVDAQNCLGGGPLLYH